jgi:hypothetical protein
MPFLNESLNYALRRSGVWQLASISSLSLWHRWLSLHVILYFFLSLSFLFFVKELHRNFYNQSHERSTSNKQQATIENHVDIPPSQSNIFIYILATHEEEQVFVLFEINILAKKCFIT